MEMVKPSLPRLVLRRGLKPPEVDSRPPAKDLGTGYWVKFHEVLPGRLFHWNGHWYIRGFGPTAICDAGEMHFRLDTPVFIYKKEDQRGYG